MVRASALRMLPVSRSECRDDARPCPMVSCRYHLLLDVASDGRLYLNRDVDEHDADSIVEALREMPETCALDVAERNRGATVEAIAQFLGLRDEREVKRLIAGALAKLRAGEHEFDEREHPEDPYLRYVNMGADELAEITAELRARGKVNR